MITVIFIVLKTNKKGELGELLAMQLSTTKEFEGEGHMIFVVLILGLNFDLLLGTLVVDFIE